MKIISGKHGKKVTITQHGMIELEMFNYALIVNFFDNRHWDYEEGCWEKYDEQ